VYIEPEGITSPPFGLMSVRAFDGELISKTSTSGKRKIAAFSKTLSLFIFLSPSR
jgi:hypothetical protein